MSKTLEVIEEIRNVKPALMAAQHAASLTVPEIGSVPAQDNLLAVIHERCGTLEQLIDEALDNIDELEGNSGEITDILMNLHTAGMIPLTIGSGVVFEMTPEIDYEVILPEAAGQLVLREGFFGGFTILDIEGEGIDPESVEPTLETLEICASFPERHMEMEDRFIPLSRIDLGSIQPGQWVPLPHHPNPTIEDIWKP